MGRPQKSRKINGRKRLNRYGNEKIKDFGIKIKLVY